MTRLDWFFGWRVLRRILLAIVVLFGLVLMVESLDAGRWEILSQSSGWPAALLAIVAAAMRWSVHTLSVATLIGAIIALVELQWHRELVVAKASGLSVWRLMRGPMVLVMLLGLGTTFGFDAFSNMLHRSVWPGTPDLKIAAGGDDIWFEQETADGRYIIHAQQLDPAEGTMRDVEVYLVSEDGGSAIVAPTATLEDGQWRLENARRLLAENPSSVPETIQLAVSASADDLGLLVSATMDLTIYELLGVHNTPDTVLRAAIGTRLGKLLALPFLLVGSLLIAFASVSGYRRTNRYGGTILYGIVAGFTVFMATEMAERAGSAGVLNPVVAAAGPSLLAIVFGATVLLRREDGRA